MPAKTYAIEGGEEGKKRLDLLSRIIFNSTNSILEKAGLAPGMNCLDVGCGGGTVTRLIAEKVGIDGHAYGIDYDPKVIEMAISDAYSAGLKNIDFEVQDVMEIKEKEKFDLVYARFILSHLRNPQKLLKLIHKALINNGIIVIEDVDFPAHFSYPENHAFKEYIHLYEEVIRKKGADPAIGPKLFHYLHINGFKNIQINIVQPVFADGEGKTIGLVTLQKIKKSLLDEKLLSANKIDELIEEFKDFTNKKDAIISMPRIFQLWAKK